MSKKADTTNTTKINRRFVPTLLAKKYKQDYEASLAKFPADKKIEFVEHLLECFDIIQTYMSSPTKENWKIYADKQSVFLKKHGKRLQVYHQKRMNLYYGDPHVLAEKEIYTNQEWNSLSGEEQQLSPEEFASFAYYCRNVLSFDLDFLLLEQNPEDEMEGKNLSGGKNQRFKVKREANDHYTSLSQEQTVLFMHFLQKERVLLKDEYLSDMDAGKAFEILTGYSPNTLRQKLSAFHLYCNDTNLTEIRNLLIRLKAAVDNTLKEI